MCPFVSAVQNKLTYNFGYFGNWLLVFGQSPRYPKIVGWFALYYADERTHYSETRTPNERIHNEIAERGKLYQAVEHTVWNKKIPEKAEIMLDKMYYTPVILYGTECWRMAEIFVDPGMNENSTNYLLKVIVSILAVKQRMQMENSPYKTFLDCINKVYKTEGIRAFYRSYGTQLLMNIPFQSSHFIVYEVTSNYLNPTRAYSPVIHVIAGGIAGGVAAAITTPLDVCKTLLNTQKYESTVIGVKNAIKTVYNVAGPIGFFRGIVARVLFVSPSTAICWGTYESLRAAMRMAKED